MFKVIESKEEFFAAARAGLLWGNYQTEETYPSQWEAMEWRSFAASLLYAIWDKAERERDPNTWRTFDFAVLVEEDDYNGD